MDKTAGFTMDTCSPIAFYAVAFLGGSSTLKQIFPNWEKFSTQRLGPKQVSPSTSAKQELEIMVLPEQSPMCKLQMKLSFHRNNNKKSQALCHQGQEAPQHCSRQAEWVSRGLLHRAPGGAVWRLPRVPSRPLQGWDGEELGRSFCAHG